MTVYLDEPRPLTPHERALLERLLEATWITDEVRRQAELATVVGVCSCGCPSLTLRVPDDAPVASLDVRHTDVRYEGDGTVQGLATSPDGRELDVCLHVVRGRLEELEIWPQGVGDPHTELPDAKDVKL